MGIFLGFLAFILFVLLVLSAAFHPIRPAYSLAELKRRAKHSQAFTLELDRFELHGALAVLLRSIRALALVLLTCALIAALGWVWGIAGALLAAILYPVIARLQPVYRASQRLYLRLEPKLLDFVARFERIVTAFREPTEKLSVKPHQLHSKEELAEVIQHSQEALSQTERQLLASGLAFSDKTVETIMTPRSVIDSIKQSEFLGPLVLDELHALGHSRLPVINEDLDHVVGILHIRDLLSLDVRNSATAEKVMEKKVFYIRKDDSLEHALAAFLRTRHHLFIVINEQRETVGLVTLEDVVEALIGRRIVDEDDIHADLRSVAEMKTKHVNVPAGHVDL